MSRRDKIRALHDACARALGIPFLTNEDALSTEDLCALAELDECVFEYQEAHSPSRCPGCGARAAKALMCKRCKKTSAHCTCMDREAIRNGECNRVPCPHPQHPRA